MVKIRGLLMIVPSGRFSIRKKAPFHFEWFLWKSHVRTIFIIIRFQMLSKNLYKKRLYPL